MTNGNNVEARLSAVEAQMEEIRELLKQTAQIANSNAKSIEANSAANTQLREDVRLSLMDILGLCRETAIQQQQNTSDIRDLRAIVQDWLTQDRA